MTKPANPEFYRCFGCDRVTRDQSKVVIGADGYLRCADCVAYEARLAAPVEIPVLVREQAAKRLGRKQRAVLAYTLAAGSFSGVWGPGRATVAESLVQRGLIVWDETVGYAGAYVLTALGKAVAS